jgi:hypothetical protein
MTEPTQRPWCAFAQAKSGPLRRIKRTSSSVMSRPMQRHQRAFIRPNRGHYAASSRRHLQSCRDRRNAPDVRLLRPNRGPMPRQADFIFGHIGTDATPPTGVYSSQIEALRRVKRTSSSVISGPMQCPRRAFIQAKSGPLHRVKRTSSSVISGPTQRPRRAFIQAKSGPLRRIKRSSYSVTMISDGRGRCALTAAHAHAVTYPVEGHLEDYAPFPGIA